MITLQRKLAIKVKDHVFKEGNAPKGILQNQIYPVIGYSVQMRDRVRGEETKTYEEIAVFLVVNNKQEIGYVYPSYCEIIVDPFVEEICNSEFMKEQKANEKAGAEGQTKGAA